MSFWVSIFMENSINSIYSSSSNNNAYCKNFWHTGTLQLLLKNIHKYKWVIFLCTTSVYLMLLIWYGTRRCCWTCPNFWRRTAQWTQSGKYQTKLLLQSKRQPNLFRYVCSSGAVTLTHFLVVSPTWRCWHSVWSKLGFCRSLAKAGRDLTVQCDPHQATDVSSS
jgi:hypothetical protein